MIPFFKYSLGRSKFNSVDFIEGKLKWGTLRHKDVNQFASRERSVSNFKMGIKNTLNFFLNNFEQIFFIKVSSDDPLVIISQLRVRDISIKCPCFAHRRIKGPICKSVKCIMVDKILKTSLAGKVMPAIIYGCLKYISIHETSFTPKNRKSQKIGICLFYAHLITTL